MITSKQFLNQEQLQTLNQSVIANLNDDDSNYELENHLQLQGAQDVVEQIRQWVSDSIECEVALVQSSVELISQSTINYSKGASDVPLWKTDTSNRWISGGCFNLQVVLYNDSDNSQFSAIDEKDNQPLYQGLGDRSYPITVYSRGRHPDFFQMLPPGTPEGLDLIIINGMAGSILPMSTSQLNITHCDELKVGDMLLFDHNILHGNTHQGGMRIMLNLKFRLLDAIVNSQESNPHYALFHNAYSDLFGFDKPTNNAEEFDAFAHFKTLYLPKSKLSKHSLLAHQTIRALLA